LVHAELRAVKVGVGKAAGNRLRVLGRTGWKPICVWTDLEASVAFRVEVQTLAWWRSQGISDFVHQDLMPDGGHTETAAADEVDIAETRRFIESLIPMETVRYHDEVEAQRLQAPRRKLKIEELDTRRAEDLGLLPVEPFPGHEEPWRFVHIDCGREVTKSGHQLTRRGVRPCSYCSKRKIDPDHAVAIMRERGLEPLEPYPGMNKRHWRAACNTCGREHVYKFNSVTSKGVGCPYCAGQLVEPGIRLAVMREARLEPLVEYPGNNKAPWLSRCMDCGREVTPRYNSIKNGQGGCRTCTHRRRKAKLLN
jgi:DNA-directed RNA polymerase subunit RPC12/RpoP